MICVKKHLENLLDCLKDEGSDRASGIAGNRDAGFSLIEAMFTLVIILIALLGIFAVFTYAINYNAGNKSRAQALAVMQQEAELFRSAKFNSSGTDNFVSPASPSLCRADGLRNLLGRTETACDAIAPNGFTFTVRTTVDNEPFVAGIQDEAYQCLSPQNAVIPCTLKEVTIEVRLSAPSPGWQVAIPARIVLRRVRGN